MVRRWPVELALSTCIPLYTTISLPRAFHTSRHDKPWPFPVHFRLFSVLFFLKLLP